jgi:hypothetical protein
VAQPLRALIDIVCLRKLESESIKALTQSMRIDNELLMQTKAPTWQALQRVYPHKRMATAIDALQFEQTA